MTAAVALGSNLPSAFGDRAANLREALRRMEALGRVMAVSSFHDTEPVGYAEQPRFLNAAALVETELAPLELLRGLLEIERAMGRDRANAPAKGPRMIDLDLLLYGDVVMESEELTLPHPAMHERVFVLGPLAEIAGEMNVPAFGRSVEELLREVELSPADAPQRKLGRVTYWGLLAASVACSALLMLYGYAVLYALGAFAAYVEVRPMFVLLAAGLVISIVGIVKSRRASTRRLQVVGYVVHSLALIPYALMLVAIVLMVVFTTRQRFLIPAGFRGSVMIFHSPKGSPAAARNFWRTTIRVPASGVMVTAVPDPKSFFSQSYFYEDARGQLTELPTSDSGKVLHGQENDGVSVHGNGGAANGDLGDCSVQYTELFVGTMKEAEARKPVDVDRLAHEHPEACVNR